MPLLIAGGLGADENNATHKTVCQQGKPVFCLRIKKRHSLKPPRGVTAAAASIHIACRAGHFKVGYAAAQQIPIY